jgi:hypothetical protein
LDALDDEPIIVVCRVHHRPRTGLSAGRVTADLGGGTKVSVEADGTVTVCTTPGTRVSVVSIEAAA